MTKEELNTEQLLELHAAHIASNERVFEAIDTLYAQLPKAIGDAMRAAYQTPKIEFPEQPPYPDARPIILRAILVSVVLCIVNLLGLLVLFYAIK